MQNKIIQQYLIITFQLTEQCNLRCKYCYQQNKTYHSMSFIIAQKFIDILFQQKNINNSIIIEFIGGEPFFKVDLMEQIMNYIAPQLQKHNISFTISITTNGTLLLNKNSLQFLTKWKDHLSLTVSLDGCQEAHDKNRVFPNGQGSFKQVLKGIKFWQSLTGQLPLTKVTISPSNLKYLSESIIFLLQLGYTYIPMNCIYENVWEPYHAQQYYQQLKIIADYIIDNNLQVELFAFNMYHGRPISPEDNRIYCGGNGHMLALKWNGDIYPCLRAMEERTAPLIIGNVESGIGILPEHQENLRKLQNLTRKNISTDKCYNCPIAFGCDHCLAYDYSVNKDFMRTTTTCLQHHARILANVYYWNKKWRKEKEFLRFKINMPDSEALQIVDKQELKQLKKLARLI